MLELQNGVCAICGQVESDVNHKTQEVRGMAVDHCHDSGKIRGLLCRSCNTLLGNAKDNIDILKRAIDYLS